MKRTYSILTVPGFQGCWDDIPAASIDTRPWKDGGPLPPAEARAAFDGSRFHVRLKAWETGLCVVTHTGNGPVWEDSCVEFFLNPAPGRDKRYLNFEINAEGVMLLGLGEGRDGRMLIDYDPTEFGITADVPPCGAAEWDKPCYSIRFAIPVKFLESIYGRLDFAPGAVLAGNFQKCGDKTANPHYGCWNLIEAPEPEFHRPDCFGELVIK